MSAIIPTVVYGNEPLCQLPSTCKTVALKVYDDIAVRLVMGESK